MKKIASGLLLVMLVCLAFISCDKKKDPPELPPYESMVVDFSKFMENDTKAADDLKSTKIIGGNYAYALINVGVFNTILAVTLAVPTACFYNSFSVEPVFVGDSKWQWSVDYTVLGGTYHARLTGEVRSDDVKWEMYVSRDGIGAFEEFMWYEGTSLSDGSGGQWILKHSQLFQEPLLQIDWERTGDEVGMVRYTNIRLLDDNRNSNVQYNAYIEAGLLEGDFDGYYDIHVYDVWTVQDFVDVNIEWNTTAYNGRVKSPLYFQDGDWHCWDGTGADVTCE